MKTETKVLRELKHLRKFYASHREFKAHVLSGEVKMSIPDVVKMMSVIK
jgi:hypothetical protein